MIKTSSLWQPNMSDFYALGISCPEESFFSLLSISIEEYAANLRSTIQRLELLPGDHVLIFRTANIHLMEALLTSLFKMVSGLTVDLVTQESFLPYIRHPQVKPILIPEGPINKETFSKLQRFLDQSYRLALVPYSNARGEGYDNVLLAVQSVFSGKKRGIGSNGRIRNINRYLRLAKVCRKPLCVASFVLMLTLLAGMGLWFKGWILLKRQFKKILSRQ